MPLACERTSDGETRLAEVQQNGSQVASLGYDSLGPRTQKVAGTPTTWTYEDAPRETGPGNAPTFVPGPGIDESAATDAAATPSYLHADALVSAVKATDSSESTSFPLPQARFRSGLELLRGSGAARMAYYRRGRPPFLWAKGTTSKGAEA